MSAPAQDFVAQVDAQVDVGGAQVDVGGGAQVDVGGGAGGGAGAGAGVGGDVGGGAGGGGAGGGGAGGVGGGGVGGGGVVAGAEGRLVSVSSGGGGSGVGLGLCLPSVSELRDLLCLTSATLRRSVEGGARQQSQLEQQQEQLSLQAAHTRLIGEQLRGVHELQRCQSGQLERLDAGQRLQSEQLAQLGSGQRQQGEQLSRALASLEDFKKAMGAQAPALGQKIDSIASSQASDFNSFPLLMKQVVALMATKLMDSKNGFVVCFPTVVAREQQQTESRGGGGAGGGAGAGAGAGGSRLVFMICVPLLMQGMVLFDKVLARKISMTLLRKMIGDYLPLLGLTDELYEAAYRTFPCTQYKGPSGRKAGKAQKEKYCTFHHPDALLPLLRQGQAHAHQYGYKAGVLADDIQNKEFRDLPGKNQMWIGVHSDAYLGNWGSKVNVVALQDDIDAYDEFVKCCQEQEPVQGNGSSGSGSSSSSSSGSSSSSAAGAGAAAGSGAGAGAGKPTYHFNGLTLFLRRVREHGGGKSPYQPPVVGKSPRGMGSPPVARKQPRSSLEAANAAAGNKKNKEAGAKETKAARKRQREETQEFFDGLEGDDGVFEDEGLREAMEKARRKKAKQQDAAAARGAGEGEGAGAGEGEGEGEGEVEGEGEGEGVGAGEGVGEGEESSSSDTSGDELSDSTDTDSSD